MPVGVMAPVVVMVAPVAEVTDAPRTEVGPDHRAAAMRVIIGIIIIRVVGRPVEETPVKMMVVCEPGAAIAIAAAVEDRTGAKAAAMEYGAATVEAAAVKRRTTAAVKTAAAMEAASATTAVKAAATSTTVASATAMSTVDIGRQSVGGKFRRGRGARIDQRQRLRALRNG